MQTLRGAPGAALAAGASGRKARTPAAPLCARPGGGCAEPPAALASSRVGPPPALRAGARGAAAGRRTRRSAVPASAVAPWHPEAPEPLDADEPTPGFASIPDSLAAVARGEFVVVMDDEDRENEGDLICAADKMTPAMMAFMVRYTSGVVCVALEDARADVLGLPLMVDDKVRRRKSRLRRQGACVPARRPARGGASGARRTLTRRAPAAPIRRAGQRGEAAHRLLRHLRPEGAATVHAAESPGWRALYGRAAHARRGRRRA